AAGAGSAAVVASTARVPSLLLHAAASMPKADENRLVVIQLTGGNDGLNTVVPYADDIYHQNRFATRIAADRVHRLNDYVGFHPSLEGLADLFEEGQLAVVQGVGYPNPNRSHFESMDIWHTAGASSDLRQTGWLGRFLDATQQHGTLHDAPAVHFGSRVQPLALAGLNVHSPSIDSLEGFQLRGVDDSRLAETIQRAVDAQRRQTDELVDFLQAAAQTALKASRSVQRAIAKYETRVDYPSTPLARKLRGVAQLIDAGMSTRIYYVTLDGFDTHSEQAEAHAALLREFSEAATAFLKDLASHGHADRVAVLAFSEFGRRVRENASRGTDHGAAAPVFLLGGKVQGQLAGEYPRLDDLVDGDLAYSVDFRQVYSTLLEDWLAADSQGLLGKKYARLPLFS
ncbi:MAG: DUF1501 domain-containing protein, partial [Planctomycetota bacterium]